MCTFIDYCDINFEVVLFFFEEEHIVSFQNPIIWISKNLIAHQFETNKFHGLVTFFRPCYPHNCRIQIIASQVL